MARVPWVTCRTSPSTPSQAIPRTRLPSFRCRWTDDVDEPPLSPEEREELITDLADLEGFRALLEPRDVLGIVIECEDCGERHYMDWDLVVGNLRSLLTVGRTRVHEPAYSPDPTRYVSWEYARGYSDAVLEAADDGRGSTAPDDLELASERLR